MFRIFVIGLVICQAAAVVNNNEAQRREAPGHDTYGPPPLPLELPAPVYGIPNGPVAHYPPPPPDVPPPPPSGQYGVPIQKYGPPKVHLEYGPPKAHFGPKPVYGPPPQNHFQQQQHHHQHQHHHHQQQHHQQQHEVSFLDQLKSTFGFGTPSTNYGPPPPQYHRKQHFPKPNYGPPPPPQQISLPVKNFGSFGAGSSFSSGGHVAPVSGPIPTYGPPPHLGPHFNPDIRCDGWKPIPGPSIQPDTGYGLPPASGSGYNGNADFGQQIIESSHVETHGHGSGSASQGIIFDLPKPEAAQPFHIESNSFAHGNLNSGKSQSFEISSNGIADTYGPPAPSNNYGPPPLPATLTSYGPPAPIPAYGPPKSQNAYLPPVRQFGSLPNAGLLPPSGVYGVPPGGSYSSLAISHGSVSGNLKPWPVSGTAPIRPIIHRQPVPAGLIESIGHHVKQFDNNFNGHFRHQQQQQQHNVYVPPIIDIQAPHGLNSLPLENAARPFLTQHNTQINAHALPLIHEPRGIIGGNDCGHGPSNLHLQQHQQLGFPQPIQDSYGPPPSGNVFTSQAAAFGNIEGHANFITPSISTSFELPAGHVPHAEYGVPNFGNQFGEGHDNFAFGSSLKSETVKITGEKVNVQPKDNSLTIDERPSKSLEPPTSHQSESEQQQSASTASPLSAPPARGEYDDEATRLDVAGLTGLNVVSAQKSQSITIPVEGARGNYELQFQATDQTGAASAPHEQLLSEGLLQQILSAIEQPGQTTVPQVTQDEQVDHDEVKIFLKSPEADPLIREPPAV